MPFVRRNVWKLPARDETLLWYGRAVERPQALLFSDITSWWSLAARHGKDETIWRGQVHPERCPVASRKSAASPLEAMPAPQLEFPTMAQGYLLAFERIVRRSIVELGGPKDWALPYWNYLADAGRISVYRQEQ